MFGGTHAKASLGSKRNGEDPRKRAKHEAPTKVSYIVTRRDPKVVKAEFALQRQLEKSTSLLRSKFFQPSCPFRGILEIEVARGIEGLISYYGDAVKALEKLSYYHGLALDAKNTEQAKQNRLYEQQRKQQQRRKKHSQGPLVHKMAF